jgi:hypothetical protein
MKRSILLLVFLCIFFIGAPRVNAEELTKEQKQKITIQGWDFYASMLISFNDDEEGISTGQVRQAYIPNFAVEYDEDNNIVIGKVKRSTINNVIQDTDYSVSAIILNLDFYDYALAKYYVKKVTAIKSGETVVKTYFILCFYHR